MSIFGFKWNVDYHVHEAAVTKEGLQLAQMQQAVKAGNCFIHLSTPRKNGRCALCDREHQSLPSTFTSISFDLSGWFNWNQTQARDVIIVAQLRRIHTLKTRVDDYLSQVEITTSDVVREKVNVMTKIKSFLDNRCTWFQVCDVKRANPSWNRGFLSTRCASISAELHTNKVIWHASRLHRKWFSIESKRDFWSRLQDGAYLEMVMDFIRSKMDNRTPQYVSTFEQIDLLVYRVIDSGAIEHMIFELLERYKDYTKQLALQKP